jgi:hypothetical protein
MGQSTDAILFFGFCWDKEDEYPWTVDGKIDPDGDDAEIRYAAAVGITQPVVEYSDDPEVQKIFHNYWDARSKAMKKSKCHVGTHCSGECPMYYVAVTESETKAYRGSPEVIKNLDITLEWVESLTNYCRKMGIEIDREPKWWLVSDWD